MAAVVGLILGACVTAQAGYRTEATIRPVGEAHQFEVTFRIMEVAQDGKTNVLSAPRIVVTAGQEGQIRIGSEAAKEEDGVFCTVLVKEADDGVEAVTTVTIKEKGSEKLSTSQSITLKR